MFSGSDAKDCDPIVVHGAVADGREYAVTTVPARVSLSQTGGATAGPAVCTLMPPLEALRWKATPFTVDGVANTDACAAPAPRSVRIISPALVHWLTFCTLAMRAVSSKSPLTLLDV